MMPRCPRCQSSKAFAASSRDLLAVWPQGKEPTLEGFPPESFDCVLLDAPCSALGLRPRYLHRVGYSIRTTSVNARQE